MKTEMICVSCPVGCLMTITGEENITVEGNECPAGIKYAHEEMKNPTRNITTSVRVSGGVLPMLSVKTNSPIPKGLIMNVVKEIHAVQMKAPVSIGDVIIKDVLDTGVDIVATREIKLLEVV